MEMFVAVADSVLHRRGLVVDDLVTLMDPCPPRLLRWLSRCDVAESGTESLVRVRLRSRRIRLRPQVVIDTVGRVDFLVGRRFVIEVDSREHHTSEAAHQNDRRRDRRLVAMGYIVVRLTYHDVVHDWDDVLCDLLSVIRSGAHLLPPTPGTGWSPRT